MIVSPRAEKVIDIVPKEVVRNEDGSVKKRNWRSVCYGNGTFVTVSYSGGGIFANEEEEQERLPESKDDEEDEKYDDGTIDIYGHIEDPEAHR